MVEKENSAAIKIDKRHVIYHVLEKDDSSLALPITESLKASGFDVRQPDFTRSFNRIDSHWKNLVECDAVLIQYSGKNEAWVSSKLNDIVKAPGYGRTAPFKALAMYIDGNYEIKSSRLLNDIIIVKREKNFEPVLLEPFIKKIG